MLSAGAEAALLKTLEEPPPHVVFVLATTDPQKVRDTIRSRTQHLRFHLLPPDELAEHVRWVAADAGLELDEAAIDAALAQGGGSARDTLSALELIANAGGSIDEAVPVDELVQAMIDHDPGHALTAMAHAVNAGHEPRVVVDALVRHLRNGFLALMAPELVQLSAHQVDDLAGWAQRLGPAALVKAIERFGEILVELRHAPDPRVLVEVALVQLTTAPPPDADDVGALAARVAKLEQAAATGRSVATPAPVDPATGRTALGGRARRDTPPEPPPPTVHPPPPAAAAPAELDWEQFKKTLRGLARPLYTAVDVIGIDGDAVTMVAPTAPHMAKCEQHRVEVESAWAMATGRPVTIRLTVAEKVVATPAKGTPPADDEVDLDELVDAGQAPSTLDRLAEAFPGAELVERDD
jgi:DNA polymerase-3 subunit gamma/tau